MLTPWIGHIFGLFCVSVLFVGSPLHLADLACVDPYHYEPGLEPRAPRRRGAAGGSGPAGGACPYGPRRCSSSLPWWLAGP